MERIEGTDETSRAAVERTLAGWLREEEGCAPHEARRGARDLMSEARERFGHGLALLGRWWWVRLLQGALAIIVGAMFFARPTQALGALVLTLGAWAIVDGMIWLVGAVGQRSWHLALGGAAGIALGYLVLTRPLGAVIVFFNLAAIWAMARGISEIAYGASLRSRESGVAWVIALGIVSFLFGLGMLISPLFGILALAFMLGAYALSYGLILVVLAMIARGTRRDLHDHLEHVGRAQPLPT